MGTKIRSVIVAGLVAGVSLTASQTAFAGNNNMTTGACIFQSNRVSSPTSVLRTNGMCGQGTYMITMVNPVGKRYAFTYSGYITGPTATAIAVDLAPAKGLPIVTTRSLATYQAKPVVYTANTKGMLGPAHVLTLARTGETISCYIPSFSRPPAVTVNSRPVGVNHPAYSLCLTIVARTLVTVG